MKACARALLLGLLRWSGFMLLWRFFHRRCVTILMLHGVMDDRNQPGWKPLRPRISREILSRYLRALSRRYHFVSLSNAAAILAKRVPMKPNSLVLTFDDGYRNNATHALPILRRFGAPMTIFLPAGKIDGRVLFVFDRLDYALQEIRADEISLPVDAVRRKLPIRPRAALKFGFSELRSALKAGSTTGVEVCAQIALLVQACESQAGRTLEAIKESDDWAALLDWSEIQRLAHEDAVEFGSHTVDHVPLALASPAMIRDQLRRSKKMIEERTGKPCSLLSFPNGSYNPAVVAIAREEGYVCAVTDEEGLNEPGTDLMALRRIALPHDATVTELLARVSGLSHALSRLKSIFMTSRSSTREDTDH